MEHLLVCVVALIIGLLIFLTWTNIKPSIKESRNKKKPKRIGTNDVPSNRPHRHHQVIPADRVLEDPCRGYLEDPRRGYYLENPCRGCSLVNSKRDCRYARCRKCCKEIIDSCCHSHRTSYNNCLLATEHAQQYEYNEFDLSYCELNKCPIPVCSIGPQLVSLNISNNKLQTLPNDIGELVGLRELFLQYNRLIALPNSLCHLKKLIELDIKNNLLTALPDNIGSLKRLICLTVTNNKLKSLPHSISYLSHLEELSLHGNQLEWLPRDFPKLTSLKLLYLGANGCLHRLPDQFGCLKQLVVLDCSDCGLRCLPDTLTDCSHLTTLWLSNNELVKLPHNIGSLKYLKELHLKSNRLSLFPRSIEQLDLYRFSAGDNCLITKGSQHLVKYSRPSLLEISLRAVYKYSLQTHKLPDHLNILLSQHIPCYYCNVPTFSDRNSIVAIRTIGVFYRLPLLTVFCAKCFQ